MYARRNQMSGPMSERERLAGAGPSDDEQGRAAVLDRLLLGGVQLPGFTRGDVADLGLGGRLLHESGSLRHRVSWIRQPSVAGCPHANRTPEVFYPRRSRQPREKAKE